jgi:hypothetical protein
MALFTAIGVTLGVVGGGAAATAVGLGATALVGGVANAAFNKPKTPAPTDYTAASQAQYAANLQAAKDESYFNNPDYITPYGSQKVTRGGTPKFDQAGYDAAVTAYQQGQGNQGAGSDEYGNYNPGYSAPMPTREQFTSTSGDPNQITVTQTLTPDAQAALDAQMRVQRGLAQTGEQALGAVQQNNRTPFQYQGPGIQTSLGQRGPIDYGPAPDQYGLAGSVNADAYGLAQGFDASRYGNARGELDLSGVARMPINAGMTAQQAIMSRLGPQLEAHRASTAQNLANQGVTPGSQAWNTAMQAQSQGENDLLTQAQLQGLNLDMAANQQGYGQQLSSAGLYNSALGQNFSQGLQANQASNQAIGQNYGQGITSQQLRNAAIGQNYGQGVTSSGLYNQAQNQAFNQGLSASQFGNTAQQQDYSQQLQNYNQPMNNLTALMSGSQIQTPQFQGYTGGQVAAAPIFEAAKATGAQNMGIYGQQVAANNAATQGLFSLGGSAFGAGFGGMGGSKGGPFGNNPVMST